MTEDELKGLFDELNRTRFGGALAKYKVSWNEPGNGMLASCHHWFSSIYISPVLTIGMDKDQVRGILLHEMCHAATRTALGPEYAASVEPGHGRLFRAQMMRLYKRGETWVLRDLARAAKADAEAELETEMMEEMSRLAPTLTWRAVRAKLIGKFGRRATEFLGWSSKPKAFWEAIALARDRSSG